MIYISSSCLKFDKIKDSILYLVNKGVQNIELSGGTRYYDGIINDLIELKEKYNLNYLIHNYFPPPAEDFVLNLASIDEEIFNKSMVHFKNAISLAEKVSIRKFGLHAGFMIDPVRSEIGKEISFQQGSDRNKSLKQFIAGFRELLSLSEKIDLYIENNVLSAANYRTFGGNVFLLVQYCDYEELRSLLEFNAILDIAHLKVTCKTLNLDFEEQIYSYNKVVDYLHVSDNDGYTDSNKGISKDSEMFRILSEQDLGGKTITIEVYESFEKVQETFNNIAKLL